MTKSYEFTGRTTQEAIDAGLAELRVDIGDVHVDIVEEGSKGLFGLFGSRPAKVRLTLEEEEEKEENIFAHMLDEEPAREKQQKKASVPEKPAAKAQADRAPRQDKAERAPQEAKKEDKADKPAKENEGKPAARKKQPRPAKDTAPASAEKTEKADKSEQPAQPVEPAPQADPASKEGKAQQYLQELTALMGLNVSVAVHTDEEGNVRVNMSGDSKGILIGRRGETLDALQYLTSLQVNKGQEEYTRVTLDTENYRAKREEALVRLANRMANRCQKTGRKVSLEPMNPYERRILHSALQSHPAVTTHSEGEEPNRRVVITLK